MFIIESCRMIREVSVIQDSDGMCIIRFTDTRGMIRVRRSRLFMSREDAQAVVDQYKAKIKAQAKPADPVNTQSAPYVSQEMRRRYELDFSGFQG